MKHRTVHGKMLIRMERFEGYLLEGAPKSQMGRRLDAIEAAVLCNLERAAKAPFPARVKVAVLLEMYFSSQPNKTLLAMKALCEMAREGSKTAKKAFEEMADRWLRDETIRNVSMDVWARGFMLILNSASVLGVGGLQRKLREAENEDPCIAPHVDFWRRAVKLGCDVL